MKRIMLFVTKDISIKININNPKNEQLNEKKMQEHKHIVHVDKI
jgi:hypothetical protein